VIFDCPPGISPLSEVAIRKSDLVIVPTISDFISVYGINGFLRVFWRAPKGALPRPKLKPHVLITRFLKNVTQHKRKVKELEDVARIRDSDLPAQDQSAARRRAGRRHG
jgi:chromosome partitioning protein